LHAEDANDDAQGPAHKRKQGTLDQKLPYNTPAPRTERHTDRDLVVAIESPYQQQIRDVRACY
jgi:hypothetical protein